MWEVFRGAAAGPKRELVEKEARGAARGAAPDGAREAALASGPRVGEDRRFREGGARRLHYSWARAATSGRSRVGGRAACPDRQEEEHRGAEEGVSRLLGGTPRTASRRVGALEVLDADAASLAGTPCNATTRGPPRPSAIRPRRRRATTPSRRYLSPSRSWRATAAARSARRASTTRRSTCSWRLFVVAFVASMSAARRRTKLPCLPGTCPSLDSAADAEALTALELGATAADGTKVDLWRRTRRPASATR